jgi:hypothetical protein
MRPIPKRFSRASQPLLVDEPIYGASPEHHTFGYHYQRLTASKVPPRTPSEEVLAVNGWLVHPPQYFAYRTKPGPRGWTIATMTDNYEVKVLTPRLLLTQAKARRVAKMLCV